MVFEEEAHFRLLSYAEQVVMERMSELADQHLVLLNDAGGRALTIFSWQNLDFKETARRLGDSYAK